MNRKITVRKEEFETHEAALTYCQANKISPTLIIHRTDEPKPK